MNDMQREVYEAKEARRDYPHPRIQALFDTLDSIHDAINKAYVKEHQALDDRSIPEADRYADLQKTAWQEVYRIEVRIHEALQWFEMLQEDSEEIDLHEGIMQVLREDFDEYE